MIFIENKSHPHTNKNQLESSINSFQKRLSSGSTVKELETIPIQEKMYGASSAALSLTELILL